MRSLLLLVAFAVSSAAACQAKRSLIMTADPGGFSGVSEAHYILNSMENTVNVTERVPFCADVIEGTLFGHQATLVITGIGHDNAAVCMVNLLSLYTVDCIKDVLYLGTSGWTPRRGGLLDPENCGTLPANPTDQLIGIGDVCISPLSTNWECGFCDWDDTGNGECTIPPCTGHNESSVFSSCDFFSEDTSYADEVMRAASRTQFPSRNTTLEGYLNKYWEATWKGLGISSTARPQGVGVYDYHTCGEAASYNLWKGVPQDYQCRKYLASVISQTLKKPVPHTDVTCVSAMEAPGWMRVLLNRGVKGRIPFVGIRGASNYDYWPAKKDGARFVRDDDWVPKAQQDDFTVLGYRYAIQTASSIVLDTFRARPH